MKSGLTVADTLLAIALIAQMQHKGELPADLSTVTEAEWDKASDKIATLIELSASFFDRPEPLPMWDGKSIRVCDLDKPISTFHFNQLMAMAFKTGGD